MRSRVQYFINKNFDHIKMVLLVLIMVLVGVGLINIIAGNAAESERRAKAVISVVESIERETDKQTTKINGQFQALCFLIGETVDPERLKALDPPLEEQCLALDAEMTEELRRGE